MEVTAPVHGPGEAHRAAAASQVLFGQGELRDLTSARWRPSWLRRPPGRYSLTDRPTIVISNLAASKVAARGTVREGGASVNNAKIRDEGLDARGV
jgi:tyrosyl-tRNA synthetase